VDNWTDSDYQEFCEFPLETVWTGPGQIKKQGKRREIMGKFIRAMREKAGEIGTLPAPFPKI
jgi:hypothetical protein